ncbi:MAG TPA: hypothetical protein VJV78_35340 [Polyangiales bacterium]|nr:hypothetical protein [Polyangiales bacterium]
MPVDALSEIVINRARQDVAAYAANPERASTWYASVDEVEWRTEARLELGSRVAFVNYATRKKSEFVFERATPRSRDAALDSKGSCAAQAFAERA